MRELTIFLIYFILVDVIGVLQMLDKISNKQAVFIFIAIFAIPIGLKYLLKKLK